MARPRRKPPGTERRRLNLNFDMGVKSEAAAYTYLKKLSANRQATRYVTNLVIGDLAGELHEMPAVQLPKQAAPSVITESPAENPTYTLQVPETSSSVAQRVINVQSPQKTQEAEYEEPQISQEGLMAALDIFGS